MKRCVVCDHPVILADGDRNDLDPDVAGGFIHPLCHAERRMQQA